jgi:hypothetical protein
VSWSAISLREILRHFVTPLVALVESGIEKSTLTALERTFELKRVVVVCLRHSLARLNNLSSWKPRNLGSVSGILDHDPGNSNETKWNPNV